MAVREWALLLRSLRGNASQEPFIQICDRVDLVNCGTALDGKHAKVYLVNTRMQMCDAILCRGTQQFRGH